MKYPIQGKANFPVSVRISRWDKSRADSSIAIVIQDESSRLTIAEVEFTPEQFGLAVTGLLIDGLACESYVKDPRLGRKLVVENKQVTIDDLGTDVRLYRQYLEANCSEPGKFIVWNPSSQHAKKYSVEPGKVVLNYSLHSYEGLYD